MPLVETEVYINDKLLGTTSNGILYRQVSELTPGQGRFQGEYNGEEFKVAFDISADDLDKYGG